MLKRPANDTISFWVNEKSVALPGVATRNPSFRQTSYGTRSRRDRVPYDVWRNDGFLVATPGNATDFSFTQKEIVSLAGRFNIREIAYDRTFAGEIIQGLQEEGLNPVEYGQG